MVKKTLLVVLLVALAAGTVFAAPEFKMSAGGGGFFDALIYGGDAYKGSDASFIGGGAFVFFDATYAEVDVDFMFGSNKLGGSSMSTTHFGFSVLGKYPFAVGPGSLFPLAGIDYQLFLSGNLDGFKLKRSDSMGGNYTAGDIMDALSIAAGAGYDYPIGESLYIRGEFLWKFKLSNKMEKDAGGAFVSGPRVKVGVGYKF